MSPPTRVLWLIKGLGPGGAERLLVEAAAHVDRERFSYEACYLLPGKDQLVKELRAGGIPATCLGVNRVADPTWLGRLRSLIRLREYRIVHAHLPYAGIGARVTARSMGRARPAVVYTEHNTWDRYRPATRRVNAATFGLNDAAIAVSRSVARSIGARHRPSLHVIPNGIDLERVRTHALDGVVARRELGLPTGGLVVGTVGGITPKKGYADLVVAAGTVTREIPDVTFVFVGLPIDDEPIRREIAANGLGGRVILTGYRERAARLMPAFDVYCLPSLHEGMPVSLLEAMALGVPVVATSVGGVPEIASDGEDATLVPASDPGRLAAALAALLRDPAGRDRVGARARATVERFGIDEMVRKTESVYDETLESGR